MAAASLLNPTRRDSAAPFAPTPTGVIQSEAPTRRGGAKNLLFVSDRARATDGSPVIAERTSRLFAARGAEFILSAVEGL